MKMRFFFMYKVFSNFKRFNSNLETVQVLSSSYLRVNFLTVRPKAANDMALESLKLCETF
jgi:hypothetical protein